jgi:mannose-6-phosphate isomerase-like protein (cupin superfamily)
MSESSQAAQHVVRSAQTGQTFTFATNGLGCSLAAHPSLSAAEECLPAGSSEQLHRHQRARQLFYILSGRAEILMGEHTFGLGTGDSLEVPPGLAHLIRNPGQVTLSFLVISAPSTTGDRVNL